MTIDEDVIRALEFYANRDVWDDDGGATVRTPAELDGGRRARAALGRVRPDPPKPQPQAP